MVEGIGKNVSPYWIGKRVAVFPKIACGKCKECRTGHPERCTEYDYLGSRRDGAFAEYVGIPATQLLELPDNVSFEQAAMLEPMAVAANAFRTGCRKDSVLPLDSKLAVCGLGTIGLLLTMFLIDAGYHNIYVIGNKSSQKAKVRELGIADEQFFDCNDGDASQWLKDASDGGVDAFFECVGKNESICYGLDAIASCGRLVLFFFI